MGKAVPRGIKSRAGILLEVYRDKFVKDFEKNKEFIGSLNLGFSKKDRNLLVGFITRTMNKG